jgi:cysteine desulfuration protein SufE
VEIQQKADQLVSQFQGFKSWEDRYREIIQFGKKLEPMPDQFKEEKYIIKGCQSQVWLYPKFENGKIHFSADSDSMLVKGIIALLLEVYNDRAPAEIQACSPDFLKQIGISEHLSMNRTNGLASMVKQIQMYALVFQSIN